LLEVRDRLTVGARDALGVALCEEADTVLQDPELWLWRTALTRMNIG
jgi:hypothetical protein